jgi:DNA-binding transcriptional ArsR family regulator
MSKSSSHALPPGGALSFEPWTPGSARDQAKPAPDKFSHSYLVQVHGDAMSLVLESVMPMLDRVLSQKTAAVREQKLEELVDFITGQMVVPSRVDTQMAQRIASRHARVLNEFGFVTAEQLADANQSRAGNRSALADNWKKRHQVFSVRHRDESGRPREVFPLFQFEDHKPIKVVQSVLEAFGERKAPWSLALWFTSNNGWLQGQARPVDMLESAPEAVVQAARHDAAGSAA